MTAAERDETLRRLARHLAVEATQMGAPASQVLKVVREEGRLALVDTVTQPR